MFIDSARILVKAGNGGNGIVSFHREKYVAAGGPDGGDGGRGGSIIFVVDEGIRTLIDFKYKRQYKAEPGQDGGAGNCSGKSGADLTIKVPPGTMVRDELRGIILADLTKAGESFIVAKGGKGGAGNQHFATATRQVPNFAKSGDLGDERQIMLELKLLADVGLIGFPNVGKSTILSMVSAANPKIANYHFTTLDPNLGVVSIAPGNSFVIADIPGLIEGAHEGVGLGHEFLKHIERTKLLVHVVDISSIEGRDPISDFEVINEELEKYNSKLIKKPQVVAANKTDICEDEANLKRFTEYVEAKGYKVFPMSAAANKGLKELMYYLAGQLKEIPDTILIDEVDQVVLYTEDESKPFEIKKEGNVFVVEGSWVRKIVGSTNLGDTESLQYFQRAIRKKGIIDALESEGINEGDTVKMYEVEFDYVR